MLASSVAWCSTAVVPSVVGSTFVGGDQKGFSKQVARAAAAQELMKKYGCTNFHEGGAFLPGAVCRSC